MASERTNQLSNWRWWVTELRDHFAAWDPWDPDVRVWGSVRAADAVEALDSILHTAQVSEGAGIFNREARTADAWDAIERHCVVSEAVTPDRADPYGTIGRLIDYHANHSPGSREVVMANGMTEAETEATASVMGLSPCSRRSGIMGEVVEIGDDDGQPRIVIHTTRSAIEACPANLLYRRVQVSAKQAGNRQTTGTVADISDEELLRRAVVVVAKQRGRRPAWAKIMDIFMLGSRYSEQLCRRFGIDPGTGKQAGAGSRGEVGDA